MKTVLDGVRSDRYGKIAGRFVCANAQIFHVRKLGKAMTTLWSVYRARTHTPDNHGVVGRGLACALLAIFATAFWLSSPALASEDQGSSADARELRLTSTDADCPITGSRTKDDCPAVICTGLVTSHAQYNGSSWYQFWNDGTALGWGKAWVSCNPSASIIELAVEATVMPGGDPVVGARTCRNTTYCEQLTDGESKAPRTVQNCTHTLATVVLNGAAVYNGTAVACV